jgi:hypothetical protein
MDGTRRFSAIAKPGSLLLALCGLGSGGCFGNPRDFHPGQNQGGGQGGYIHNGGQGGGQGGQGGVTVPPVCSATTAPAFTVRWSLEDSAHAPTTCNAVGAATMDLDLLNLATSVVSHDTFPCTAMAGTSMTLPAGNYSVAMRLRDSAGTLLSEADAPTSYPLSAGCSTDLGLVPFEAVVTTPDQFITLSWTIDRFTTRALLSCAEAHPAQVELDVGTNTFLWPCTDGKGATGSLPAATYSVAVKLLDATGTVLSLTPSMPVTVTAAQPNALGTVTFDVN